MGLAEEIATNNSHCLATIAVKLTDELSICAASPTVEDGATLFTMGVITLSALFPHRRHDTIAYVALDGVSGYVCAMPHD